MRRVALRVGTALVLGLGLAVLPVAAEDSKSPPTSPPTSPWSGYVFVSDVIGEFVKADDSSVTLRIPWMEPNNSNNGRRNLSGTPRNFHNPFQPHRRQQVQLKQVHHDYTLSYLPP